MKFYEKESISLYLNDLTILEQLITQKHKVDLFSHPTLGKVLIIDGEIQHIENYQALYHEQLVHLPMCFIKNPETALIIGGGSLFAAFEILKYPSIKEVILCDHDYYILKLMEKNYNHAKRVMNDPRFKYVESDGVEYIKNCSDSFDLIINDCFNLIQEGERKKTNIFDEMEQLLTNKGICCDIIYRHIFDRDTTVKTLRELKKHTHVAFSLVTVPEYPGILHIETMWGKNTNLSQQQNVVLNEYQKSILQSATLPFDFFSPEYLEYYLYLPNYIKKTFTI